MGKRVSLILLVMWTLADSGARLTMVGTESSETESVSTLSFHGALIRMILSTVYLSSVSQQAPKRHTML